MAGGAWTRGRGDLVLARPRISYASVAGSCSSELGGGAAVRVGRAAVRLPGGGCRRLSADPEQARRDSARALRRRPAPELLLRVTVKPGQNIIRLNPTNLFPQRPGTSPVSTPSSSTPTARFLAWTSSHLHHAVWVVNGNPQFAAGEEKTIIQMPKGFGWRSVPPTTGAQRHDPRPRRKARQPWTRVENRLRAGHVARADSIRRVWTRWMDVSGPSPRVGVSSPIYPVFNALRGMGQGGRYTFPDQATGTA